MSDIAQRLTDMVNTTTAQRKHIKFIAITSMDFLDLTTHVPVEGEMGEFLGIPLRLGAATEVRVRKVPTNV